MEKTFSFSGKVRTPKVGGEAALDWVDVPVKIVVTASSAKLAKRAAQQILHSAVLDEPGS